MQVTKSVLLLVLFSCAVPAAPITDVVEDLLGTYTGPRVPSVDVTAADVTYNPSSAAFTFMGTLAGAVSSAPTGTLYVFGVNRGAGTERFVSGVPSIGAGVFFDAVVILNPNSDVTVNNLSTPATVLPGAATISGNTISATVSASLLPSTGFTPGTYTYNLWPRVGAGSNVQISDFAPNASNAAVSPVPVPEPSTALLSIVSFAMLSSLRIRQRISKRT